MPTKQYLSIEGLRGILALVVCCGHFGLGSALAHYGFEFNLHYAVDIFFVISGFVLASSNYFVQKTVGAYEFFIKRIARLYPLHLITLLFMLGLNGWEAKDLPLWAFMENLFLVHNIGLPSASNAFNFPSWSICVELWCTLILFYVVKWLPDKKLLIMVLSTLIILQNIWYPDLVLTGDYEGLYAGIFNGGMLRGISGTSLGILVYLAVQQPMIVRLFKQIWGLGLIVLMGLFFLLMTPYGFPHGLVFYLFAFLAIATVVVGSQGLQLFSTRLFVGLGAISYSIYLLHIPLYHLLQTVFGDLAVKGILGKSILLPCLLLLSVLIYYFVEKPSQKILRKILLGNTGREFTWNLKNINGSIKNR